MLRLWQSELLAAQRHVLTRDGQQGGGLQRVLRHLSFAKQRYESYAAPQRHWCCLLSAVALVLAVRASDCRRSAKERAEYATRLTSIGPALGINSGLSADWGMQCRSLISKFDVTDHDPAKTERQVSDWLHKARTLFQDGQILSESNEGRTCTAIAVQSLMEAPDIRFQGDRVHSLWGPSSKKDAADAMMSMQTIYQVSESRLKAEFPVGSLLLSFSCFDLRAWHRALQMQQSDDDQSKADLAFRSLHKKIRLLSSEYPLANVDATTAVTEFSAVAIGLATELKEELAANLIKDFRPVWSAAMSSGRVSNYQLGRFKTLRFLVGWYVSVLDGTSVIERDLGGLRALLDAHNGPLGEDGETMSDLMHLFLCLPREESCIAERLSMQTEARQPQANLPHRSVCIGHLRRCIKMIV